MDEQISISLPKEKIVPVKVEVKVSESNKPERIVTTYTISKESKVFSENAENTTK